jgi:Na+-driven multidrug efflux pump
VVITFTLQIGIQLSNIVVLGYLSETALAAASLGNLYINLFSNAPGSGLATAVDTLAAQAYGARAFTRLGAVFQRAVLILIAGSVVSVILFVYSEAVLLGLGQDAELAALAGSYVQVLIIAIIPVQIFEAMKKYFQAHQLMLPPMLVAGVTVVVNAIMAYVLVHHTSLGFIGSPIALVISSWLSMILMTLFFCKREQLIRWVEAEVVKRAAESVRLADDGKAKDLLVEHDEGFGGGSPATGSASFTRKAAGTAAPASDGGEAGSGLDTLLPACAWCCQHRLENLVLRALRRHLSGRALAGIGAVHSSEVEDGDSDGSHNSQGAAPVTAGAASESAVAQAADLSSSAGDGAGSPDAKEDEEDEEDVDSVLLHTWGGWQWRTALSKWPEFLSLGLPGAVMTTLEWGTFEANAVFAGWLGVADLASHSALAQTGAVAFMVPLGLSVATAVRIGALMGEGRHQDAKMTVAVSIACGIIYTAINATVLVVFREGWGGLFTSSDDVIVRVAATMPFMALFNVFDTGQAVLSGIIRGIGRQALGAAANLVAYCGVGLASSYSIAIAAGMGLPGIWLGSAAGASLACLFLSVALYCSDWKALSDLAIERALGTERKPDEAALLGLKDEGVELTELTPDAP